MNIQLIVVIVIGIVVGVILTRAVYRFFFTEKGSSHCGGCPGCEIHKEEVPDLKE